MTAALGARLRQAPARYAHGSPTGVRALGGFPSKPSPGGTGTTALTAAVHGRTGITIDRSADYSRLAAWRVSDPGERARARELPKPPPVPDGMEPLFDMKA